jgi:hypothetical protein
MRSSVYLLDMMALRVSPPLFFGLVVVAVLVCLAYPGLRGDGHGRTNYVWMTQSMFLDRSQGSRSLKELLDRPGFQVRAWILLCSRMEDLCP